MPVLTPPLATVYAKLLSVGCPPVRAVQYCVPGLDIDIAAATARVWLVDSLVLEAIDKRVGGAFLDMEPEKRMALALDKMLAEAAFFVWTSNWTEASGKEELEKMRYARDMMSVALGRKVDTADPMQAFAAFALKLAQSLHDGKKGTKRLVEPQGEPDLLDKMGVLVGRTPS